MPRQLMTGKRFPLGRLVMTRAVNDRCADDAKFCSHVLKALARYRDGDWGDVPPEDARENERSLKSGDRLMGSYGKGTDDYIWIITEWDRSVTTVLFPSDY